MLSGCVSGASSSTTVTVTESQSTAETSASEAATEGIFASQFDPCEEFSDEQLAAAGLGEKIKVPTNIGYGARGCSFGKVDPNDYSGTFLLATDLINRESVEKQGLKTRDLGTKEIPGIYVHEMESAARQCEAAVDFDWGRFTVGYYEAGTGWEPEQLCTESAQILENLIMELRGTP